MAHHMLATLSSKRPRAKGKTRWLDWASWRRGGKYHAFSLKVKGREAIKVGNGASSGAGIGVFRYRSYIAASNRGAKQIANERTVTKAMPRKRPTLGLGTMQMPMRYANMAGA